MATDRRIVLAVVLAAVTVVTVAILRGLVGTVFFAITVAVVLVPLSEGLEGRGLPDWWAAAAATLAAFAVGMLLFFPIGIVLYVRRQAAIALLRSLPDSVTLSLGPFTTVVDGATVSAYLAGELTKLAPSIARQAPVLVAKLVVFGFVVFALLYQGDRLRRTLLGPLPSEYHDIVDALDGRVRGTLFSLYVIQAVTAFATFGVALVVFVALGVRFPVTLAVLAGVLQFLPVVGPSLVIVGIVVVEFLGGNVAGAVVIGVVGLVTVAILPDAVLRPRLARQRAHLPSSLYFVGFTGGLLSLGPVGIVAGPLAVAMLLGVLELFADEMAQPPLDSSGA